MVVKLVLKVKSADYINQQIAHEHHSFFASPQYCNLIS